MTSSQLNLRLEPNTIQIAQEKTYRQKKIGAYNGMRTLVKQILNKEWDDICKMLVCIRMLQAEKHVKKANGKGDVI